MTKCDKIWQMRSKTKKWLAKHHICNEYVGGYIQRHVYLYTYTYVYVGVHILTYTHMSMYKHRYMALRTCSVEHQFPAKCSMSL